MLNFSYLHPAIRLPGLVLCVLHPFERFQDKLVYQENEFFKRPAVRMSKTAIKPQDTCTSIYEITWFENIMVIFDLDESYFKTNPPQHSIAGCPIFNLHCARRLVRWRAAKHLLCNVLSRVANAIVTVK